MDSTTFLEDNIKTFLGAPDIVPIPTYNPKGINAAKKCIDFDEEEDENIRVYARIKPRLCEEEVEGSTKESRIYISGQEVVTDPSPGAGSSYSQRFLFNKIFHPQVTQLDFFTKMVQPRLKDFLEGHNQLIFTYGATSSGKTFTVQGTLNNPGILPRSLDTIFNSLGSERIIENTPLKPCGFDTFQSCSFQDVQEEKEFVISLGSYLHQAVQDDSTTSSSSCTVDMSTTHREREKTEIEGLNHEGMFYSLWISFAEIYNENIFDLFEKVSLSKKLRGNSRKVSLKLCEERKGSAYIKGLKEIPVSSADEAYKLLLIGRKNLHFAATKLNHNSSRSHCIFTVKIIKFCDINQPKYARVNILSFCDLAGSERIKKTRNAGSRRIETGNINASLLVLGRVMKTLRDNQRIKEVRKHAIVPFRDSKLTRLFQAFFVGFGKASMIVNISQSPYLFDETLQVLKFSAITSKISYAKEQLPAKPKRKSRFSSILFEHKRMSSLNGRNTIMWENPEARSTLCLQNKIDEKDESDIESSEEVNETHYEALTNLINDLEQRLVEEKRKNVSLESDIRTELCNEFNTMIMNVEKEWQTRMKETTERMDDLSDWRIKKLENAYNETRKRKRHHIIDDELNEKIAELEAKLEERSLEIEEIKKQNLAVKDSHKCILDARKKLQEEVTTLKFTNEDNKRKIKSMEGEIDKLTLQNRSKESAIESLSSNPIIKDLKNQLSDTERKLTAKTENAAYLKKLLDEAGEEFLEKDENESKLIEAQKSLKTELAQVKIALKDAHDEYSVLIKESNNRQEEYESIDELLYACRKENSEIVSKNKKISAELTKYKQIDNTSDSKEDASVVDNLRKRLDTTSSEVDGLLIKLNKTRQLYEDQGKILKKVEEEKNRLEKDLNDEIETLRRSKIKIESSEHEKKNLLSDKEIEIQKLEKEIKNLIQKGVANQQSLEHNSKEIEILRSDASEKQNIIENLEVQIKSSQKEDNVIKILRKELKLKEYELSKKEAIIREVELKLEKSLYDGEVEDLPRDEIESLKRDVIQANAYHSKEFDKIKKANEKVINEYKDANKELQKQVGICSNRDTADDSSQLVHQQMNESDQSFKIDSSILPTELQASGKKKRRGKVRNTQNNSTKSNNSSSILVNESNVENELNDSENSVSRSQKSNKVTRSRPVHKTKKKHVNDVDRSSISELSSVEKERNTLKETHSFEFLHSGTENTPRRSNRTTNNNNFRQYEVLKSLENLTEIEEEEERASQSFVGKRQLRTRKKNPRGPTRDNKK
nr:kinesin-like protein KIF20A [Lepeophtheirus salmonis]XP_040565183.1 kinesin-like protein KIF20A [Lepeophtheirus salmonis]